MTSYTPLTSVRLIASKSAPGNSFRKVSSIVSARRFPQITETKTNANKMDAMVLLFIHPPYNHTDGAVNITLSMQDTYQNDSPDMQPDSKTTLNSFGYPSQL